MERGKSASNVSRVGVKEAEMRILAAILALFAVWAFTVARFEEWAYKRGRKEGYARGRREIDKWWIEMDQQLDEEWAKIWKGKN